jgi:hypothetical protein
VDAGAAIAAVVILPILAAFALYMAFRPEDAHRSFWFTPEKQPSEWVVTTTRITGIFGLGVLAIFALPAIAALISN